MEDNYIYFITLEVADRIRKIMGIAFLPKNYIIIQDGIFPEGIKAIKMDKEFTEKPYLYYKEENKNGN